MKYIYSTVQSLRDLGITQEQLDDAQCIKYLTRYAGRINQITGKVFAPTPKKFQLFCDRKRVKIPGSPVLKVNSIKLIGPDGSRTLIETANYELYGKYLTFYKLPVDDSFTVEIDAIIGEMDNQKEVEIQILGAINSSSTSATLSDASALELDDILVIAGRCFVIKAINYITNTVEFDQQQIPTIPAYTTAICYGSAPENINYVSGLFVQNRGTLERGTFIKSETIGKYSYTLFDNASGGITGISSIDVILGDFIDEDEVQIFYL